MYTSIVHNFIFGDVELCFLYKCSFVIYVFLKKTLLKYSWCTILWQFQVYYIVLWHLHQLWNNLHESLVTICPHKVLTRWLIIFLMLHISSQWLIFYLCIYEFCFALLCLLTCIKIISLSLIFALLITVCLGMVLLELILFRTLCFLDLDIWISRIGKFWVIMSSKSSLSVSLSSPPGTPVMWMLVYLMLF